TQQIIAHETGVTRVVDPLGGSYYLEALTDDLERRAREEVERIDALGGALVAVEQGYMQRAIADAAYREQRAIEDGSKVVVGVNKYTETVMASPPPILKIDPEHERRQLRELQERKRRRGQREVEAALAR